MLAEETLLLSRQALATAMIGWQDVFAMTKDILPAVEICSRMSKEFADHLFLSGKAREDAAAKASP